MKVWFIQDFTRELKILYLSENKEVGQSILKPIFSLEDIIKEVDKNTQDTAITNIVLSGRTSILRKIENHYNNIEGVNIEWQ